MSINEMISNICVFQNRQKRNVFYYLAFFGNSFFMCDYSSNEYGKNAFKVDMSIDFSI